MVIDFTFEEAQKGQYPNKSPFAISDLIAPNSIAEIYTLNGLSAQEMSKSKFMHNFRITPHVPTYNLIAKRYNELLETRNIRADLAQKIQDDMREELNQLQTRAALLSFRSKWRAIDQETLENILLSVPKYWADKMINYYGVLELDVQMYSKVLFDEHQYEDLDYLVALDKVQANIDLVSSSITKLLTVPNSLRVTDEKTGYNLLDLQKLIRDILEYDLNRLSSFIQELGISTHKDAVKLYYQHQINKLEREREYQTKQADLINQTLRDYIMQLGNADQTSVVRENTVDMVQASGDFLDRIAELVKQSEDLDYRQNLHDQYIQYKQTSARIDYEIAQKQALLKALDDDMTTRKVFGARYEEKLMEERFPVILSKMQEYIDVLTRLHSTLSKENFGQDTKLYQITNVDAVKTTGVIMMSIREKAIFGLLIFGVALVTVVVKVMLRQKEKSE